MPKLRGALWVVVAVLLAASVSGAVPASASDGYVWGGVGTWPVNRTVGTSAYTPDGVWSYTNRWGKATGANLDGKHREDYFAGLPEAAALTYDAFGTHRLARNGDYYPPSDNVRFPALSANVVFVQFHPSPAGLDVRVVLNSLGQKDSSILTLGLATGSGTATSSLPRGAGLRCTGCGVERYATVWGTGSDVATPDGRSVGTVQNLAVDLTENTLTFRVPGVGSTGRALRVWLASGLHDGTGHYLPVQATQSATSPGGGNGQATNVFDLAFVQAPRATVDERVQSDLLARGEIAPAQATIDLAALRAGTGRIDGEPMTGPVEKVLVSVNNEGKGIDSGNGPASFQNPGPGDNFHYLGRTQGYLVDLPPGYRAGKAVPEVMVLHGYNGYYDEEYFLAPKMRAAIEQLGYIGVYPLGRGDVQYEHDGELDLLEVQRAVEHDYAIDRDRVHLVGISMGGFGATKAAVRHPDVFADASVFVGGEQGDINVVNDNLTKYPITRAADPATVGNLQDTPMLFGASAADADAGGAAASTLYTQLRQLGDEAHLKQYLAGTHEPAIIDLAVPQMVAQWQRSARPAVPARITYSFDTTWNSPNNLHDRYAWLRDLRPATGTDGTAAAEALTLPRTVTSLTETTSAGGSATDRSAYLLRDSLRHATAARPVSNTLDLSTSNLSASTVDLGPLHVDTHSRYCLDLTTDIATTVELTGVNFTGLDTAGVPSIPNAAGLLLHVPAGTTHAVLHPSALPGDPGTACPAAPGRSGGATATNNSTGARARTNSTGARGGSATPPVGSIQPIVQTKRSSIGGRLAATGLPAPAAGLALLAAVGASLLVRRRRRPKL
ncbi:MAG: hypothetical protein NVS3B12_26660 [Acidimicrobiales bacterium]